MFIAFREGSGGRRERNIDVREALTDWLCPDWGLNLQLFGAQDDTTSN